MPKKRIGDLLIERGLITENELSYALDLQKQTHDKLGEDGKDPGLSVRGKLC